MYSLLYTWVSGEHFSDVICSRSLRWYVSECVTFSVRIKSKSETFIVRVLQQERESKLLLGGLYIQVQLVWFDRLNSSEIFGFKQFWYGLLKP